MFRSNSGAGRLRQDLINADQYHRGRDQESGARLLSVEPRKRTEEHRLEARRFRLSVRENFSVSSAGALEQAARRGCEIPNLS